MKIAFPHMGNAYIPLKALVERLGAEAILPPKPNRVSLQLGTRFAPEFVCLPFKVNLGDNLRALELGADTLAMVSGTWACRFGYYGRIQHQILRDLGFEFDSMLLGRDGLRSVYDKFRPHIRGNPVRAWAGAVRILHAKASAVDQLEKKAREVRPFEIKKGTASRALERSLVKLESANTVSETRTARQEGLGLIDRTEQDRDRELLHVAMLGEIYAVLEPSLNFDMERKLGEMGVGTHPALSVYNWLMRPLKLDPRIIWEEYRARRRTRPYLPYVLGGEEHHTISSTILSASRGYHGVIHLYPFTCMPENICRTVLPTLERDLDIPILNLCLDEHASSAGVATRLEAFVDLLRERSGIRQRRIKKGQQAQV